MELSIEVTGIIQDVLATKIYAWDKIKTFGKRIGVDTIDFEKKFSKRQACEYIIKNMPRDNGEIVIKSLIEMAKRGLWNKDYSEEILCEINPIMERTMNSRVNDAGQIIPIFPWLEEEPNIILERLKSFGFLQGLKNYKDALRTYKTSPKGSLSLLRSAFEGVVEDILRLKNVIPTNNQRENLAKLEELGILKELSNIECHQCHYRKRDHEFNYSYIVYGLLSHYGSHKELVTEELANFLFTSTSAFIWFLINRLKV